MQGYSRRGRKHGLRSEINVTPFIDVLLVLLVIFMTTMPAVMTTVNVSLPKAKNIKSKQLDPKRIEIVITKNNELWVGNEKIKTLDILKYLNKRIASPARSKAHIVIKGDETAKYGDIMGVAAILGANGYKSLGLLMNVTN